MTRKELTDEQLAERFPKKAGRPAMPAAQPVALVLNDQATAQEVAAVDDLAQLQAGYGQERDLLNQLLGQAQMADAFSKFSKTVLTSKLAFVKENKLYQQLRGKKTQDGLDFSGTWAEFCQLLGWTPEHANEAIANLNQFGADALESMSSMGIGYRELRQYRKLPEDQKLALIEVAKAGDKEGFVELAEEIIAKHAKEKEQLTAQAAESAATLEAKDRMLADRAERINRLEEQTSHKFKPRPGSEAQTAQEQALLDELEGATLAAWHGLKRTFKAADAAIEGTEREAVQTRARQAVEWLAQELAETANEFGIQVDFEDRVRPSWLTEEALAAIEARQRGDTPPAESAAR